MAGSEDDYLPLSERGEWGDLAPRLPPATPQPVVCIGRDPLLGDLMDYFWEAVAQGELSERVLGLTGEIIRDLNSSNYTVWEWRWRCIQALGGMGVHAAQEKALTQSVATANPKNYQLWNYRRRVALALPGPGQAEEEMAFSAACLQHDAKNYHAWAHRQAVLLAASAAAAKDSSSSSSSGGRASGGSQGLAAQALWSSELAFTEQLLRQDVRNNSAWNQRVFVLRNAPPASVGPPGEAYNREVDFTSGQLRLAPHNECGWEALRACAAGPGAPPHALAADPRFLTLCHDVLGGEGGEGGAPGCSPALSLLADVLMEAASLLLHAQALLKTRSGRSSAGSGGGTGGGRGSGAEGAGAAGAAAAAQGAAAAAPGAGVLSATAVAVALRVARRLAREALERQLAADPIRRPYLRLELAALEAALRQADAAGG